MLAVVDAIRLLKNEESVDINQFFVFRSVCVVCFSEDVKKASFYCRRHHHQPSSTGKNEIKIKLNSS
jgi:hypothetical protein